MGHPVSVCESVTLVAARLLVLLLLGGEVGLVGDVGGEPDGQHLEVVGLLEPGGHRGRVLLRRHDGLRRRRHLGEFYVKFYETSWTGTSWTWCLAFSVMSFVLFYQEFSGFC